MYNPYAPAGRIASPDAPVNELSLDTSYSIRGIRSTMQEEQKGERYEK
jgi:hypothetical protein